MILITARIPFSTIRSGYLISSKRCSEPIASSNLVSTGSSKVALNFVQMFGRLWRSFLRSSRLIPCFERPPLRYISTAWWSRFPVTGYKPREGCVAPGNVVLARSFEKLLPILPQSLLSAGVT